MLKERNNHAVEVQRKKMWPAAFINIVVVFVVCFVFLLMDSDFKGKKLCKYEQDRKGTKRVSQLLKSFMNLIYFQYII